MTNKSKNYFNNFLLFKLPISIVAIVILVEFLSLIFSDYRSIRHGLDRKVANLEKGIKVKSNNILLFGDSVTKDIADHYDISLKNEILNLTTNRASGLLGVNLLYNKYRLDNSPPKKIFLICTPLFINFFPENDTKFLYIDTVFDGEEEEQLISKYYKKEKKLSFNLLNSMDNIFNLSIFNINDKIIYPLINYIGLIDTNNALRFGKKTVVSPKDFPKLENSLSKNKNFNEIKKNPIIDEYYADITINNKLSLLVNDFFTVLKTDEVKLFIAWAPIRANYHNKIINNGELEKLEKFLKNKSKQFNLELHIDDFSKDNNFPDYAFRDTDHLKSGYWKNFYAYSLQKYIFYH